MAQGAKYYSVSIGRRMFFWNDASITFILVFADGLSHPFGLDVSGSRVYWTDWETKSVSSADKLSGQDRTTIIANTSDLMDIKVFHRSRRRMRNACEVQNGGCSHLCLLNPTSYTCACPVGIALQEDGHTCSSGPSSYIIFAHRIDIRQISLDFDHLVDVVLPLPPISNAVALDVDLKTGEVFWSDTIEDIIMSSSPDGVNVNRVIYESIDNPDGLVVDSVGRMVSTALDTFPGEIFKVYWFYPDILGRCWASHH